MECSMFHFSHPSMTLVRACGPAMRARQRLYTPVHAPPPPKWPATWRAHIVAAKCLAWMYLVFGLHEVVERQCGATAGAIPALASRDASQLGGALALSLNCVRSLELAGDMRMHKLQPSLRVPHRALSSLSSSTLPTQSRSSPSLSPLAPRCRDGHIRDLMHSEPHGAAKLRPRLCKAALRRPRDSCACLSASGAWLPGPQTLRSTLPTLPTSCPSACSMCF